MVCAREESSGKASAMWVRSHDCDGQHYGLQHLPGKSPSIARSPSGSYIPGELWLASQAEDEA